MLDLNFILNRRKAVLVLQNGTIFHGFGFGSTKTSEGELVFTTFTGAGYYCALTDPSNQGQLYTLTYPLIGNYGIPEWNTDSNGIFNHFESDSIKVSGFIVQEFCQSPSHYESTKNIDDFLTEQGIPGIYGIDTRYLTQILRTEGVQTGYLKIFNIGEPIPSDEVLREKLDGLEDPNTRDLVHEVAIQTQKEYIPNNPIGKVAVIDCGVKNNILRELLSRNISIVQVPYTTSYEHLQALQVDGVLISNGPGDPKKCIKTIELTKNLIKNAFPTMGICLGHQILGLAAGGDTYKLKYGHRGGNKPVIDTRTRRAFITSQNHGYAIDESTLEGTGFLPLFRNADDQTNEGIYHPEKPIFGVQFHPEAFPGPDDTNFLFDEFIQNIAYHSFMRQKEDK